jgi:hypothetical protein
MPLTGTHINIQVFLPSHCTTVLVQHTHSFIHTHILLFVLLHTLYRNASITMQFFAHIPCSNLNTIWFMPHGHFDPMHAVLVAAAVYAGYQDRSFWSYYSFVVSLMHAHIGILYHKHLHMQFLSFKFYTFFTLLIAQTLIYMIELQFLTCKFLFCCNSLLFKLL